jgi:hypothetical protein
MKTIALCLFTLAFMHKTCSAQVIDLTSGGSGTTTGVPQSFNETRGVDITVLSNTIHLNAMTLHRFCTGAAVDSGYVSARIYNSVTQALLYAHDTVVHPMYDDSVVVPVSFVLNAGQTYRISFSCYGYGNNHNSGSAFMYQPTFPYNDASNKVQINSAHGGSVNAFPGNPNIFVPFITLRYGAATVVSSPEKKNSWQIAPNPFSTQTIVYSEQLLSNASVQIYNLFGQLVKKVDQLSGQRCSIMRSELAGGIYLLQLTQDDKKLGSCKIVVHD